MVEVIAFDFTTEDNAKNGITYRGPHHEELTNKGGSWRWSNYKTPSYGTGPQTRIPEGYVFTESSSPTKREDIFYLIIDNVIDLTSTTAEFLFSYNMNTYNSCVVNIYGWDNNEWLLAGSLEPLESDLGDYWGDIVVPFTGFTNDEFQIKLEVVMPDEHDNIYLEDVAFRNLKVRLTHNDDTITDYYTGNNMPRYNNTPIFDATRIATATINDVINNFIANIVDYDFTNYPNGVFVKGADKVYYVNSDSVEYLIITHDMVNLPCKNNLWCYNNKYRVFNDVTNSTMPTVGYNLSKNNTSITYSLENTTDFSNKHYRLQMLSEIFKYNTATLVTVSFYDSNDSVSTWDIADDILKDSELWTRSTFYTGNCNTNENNADMTKIEYIIFTCDNPRNEKNYNTWLTAPSYSDEIIIAGITIDNTALFNIIRVLKNQNILSEHNDVASITGRVLIGSTSRITHLNIRNGLFKYDSSLVASDLYLFKLVGDLSGSSEFNILNSSINGGINKFTLDASDSYIKKFILYSCRISNINELILGNDFNKSIVSYNTFSLAKNIRINGATFSNNVIYNPIDTAVYYTDTNAVFNNIYFLEYDKYVLFIDPSITAITLDNIWFSEPNSSNGVYSLYWPNDTGTLTIQLRGISNLEDTGCLSIGGMFTILPDDSNNTTGTIACDAIDTKLDIIASNVRQILAAQGENVTEMETIIIDNGAKLVL